jgi:CMP/dCMP kinase
VIITIDGPAASGKSTTARQVATRLGMEYLDTGALYRALTLAAIRAELPPQEGEALRSWLDAVKIRYRYHKGEIRLFLEDEEITEAIRSAEVTSQVSAFSALPSLREHMVAYQRQFARGRNLITEGRDMGSVVFPEAELKIFLEADPLERARRRVKDFEGQGRQVDLDTVADELSARDALDSGREHSPLIKPEGAVVLDNSALGIEEQVAEVVRLAESRWPESRIDPEALVVPESELAGLRRPGVRPIYRATWLLVRGLMRLLFGVRYHHEERGEFGGPMLVASNHIAWLDPPAVGSAVNREITFVAKRELFRFKPFGAFIAYFNAVPIRRGTFDRGCFDVLRDRLKAGETVLFFPEGTRKPVGRLGKAKFGLGLMAQESGAPVLPIFVKGTTSWWRAMLRRERVQVYMGRPLSIAPLLERGLEGRKLLDLFGEGVMAEIERLQTESTQG